MGKTERSDHTKCGNMDWNVLFAHVPPQSGVLCADAGLPISLQCISALIFFCGGLLAISMAIYAGLFSLNTLCVRQIYLSCHKLACTDLVYFDSVYLFASFRLCIYIL